MGLRGGERRWHLCRAAAAVEAGLVVLRLLQQCLGAVQDERFLTMRLPLFHQLFDLLDSYTLREHSCGFPLRCRHQRSTRKRHLLRGRRLGATLRFGRRLVGVLCGRR